MRVLVTGDRNFTDGTFVRDVLVEFQRRSGLPPEQLVLIHGGARGADTLAGHHATLLEWSVECYPANWNEHGKAAGPIRNKQMLDSGIDVCLAFHNNIVDSKGTANMIGQCRKVGKPIALYGNRQLITTWNW